MIPALALLGHADHVFASEARLQMTTTSGYAGTQVTVEGREFDPSSVEVRWNSRTGRILATGQGPSFSTVVTIPADAPAGVHYLVAMGDYTTAVAYFEVVARPEVTTTTTPTPQPQGPAPPDPASGSQTVSPPQSTPPPSSGSSPPATGSPPSGQPATSSAAAPTTTTVPLRGATTTTTKKAEGTISATTTLGAIPEASTTTQDETAATTTTEPGEDDRRLVVQPTSSRGGWGAAQVASVFVLVGLLALGVVAMGRRGRHPKL